MWALIAVVLAVHGCSRLAVAAVSQPQQTLHSVEPEAFNPLSDFILRWAGLRALGHDYTTPYTRQAAALNDRISANQQTEIGPPKSGADGNSAYGSIEGMMSSEAATVKPVPPEARLPIILVPPLTGTPLDARLRKPASTPHWWCPRQRDWYRIWLTAEILIPGQFSCIAENLHTILDYSTNTSHPLPGVEIAPTLDDSASKGGGPFNPLGTLETGLSALGWVVERDIVMHVYDWRLVPRDWMREDLAHGYQALKLQIESLSGDKQRPVILVGLSMGATYAANFLASGYVDQAWKEEHVAGLVSISGVFGGTPVAPWDIISARLEGFERVFPAEDVRSLMRQFPALSWLSPLEETYGSQPIILNTATNRTYSARQISQALRDAGAEQAALYADMVASSPSHWTSKAPYVPVVCAYSRGFRTASKLTFSDAGFKNPPDVTYADGDLTVPISGLSWCERWRDLPGHPPVVSHVWNNVMHAGILNLKDGQDFILKQIEELGWAHLRKETVMKT